jgi:Domain of unknown function (DUF4262)
MAEMSVRDEALFRIDWAIETHGFFIQYVFGDADRPPWAYTVGFLERDYPELVVLGLDDVSAAGFLHGVYDRIAAGDPPAVGREHAHECCGNPYRLVPIPLDRWLMPDDDLLLGCRDYYGVRGRFPTEPRAAQLVWADPDGYLPWEPGFEPRLRRLQPPVFDDVG